MFAKLFTLPGGQQVLLVKQVVVPYLVQVTEINGNRFSVEVPYSNFVDCDAAFERYEADAAQQYYDGLVQYFKIQSQ